MGNIFEINVVPPNMQDIITSILFLQGIEDHQSLFQTKFPHDITTIFLDKFHLALLYIALTVSKTLGMKHVSFKADTFDVILVSVLMDSN